MKSYFLEQCFWHWQFQSLFQQWRRYRYKLVSPCLLQLRFQHHQKRYFCLVQVSTLPLA